MKTFYVILALAGVWGVIGIVRSTLNAGRVPKKRGVEPGLGDNVVEGGHGAGGPGGGHYSYTRVSRNPQDYAKAFAEHYSNDKTR